ncbi:MAG TPA: class I SAM-dependent methyltransferase [Devosia sp.]|jgi:tRNA (cmo5U34)-methyltransferase|uniref:class I SAM-dependent methyltransferase n=1 Tax=Devosia sp. TaxID=1871048 RepID=UPI002F92631B
MTITQFNASHAAGYAERPFAQVPGLQGLHWMMSQLLAEHVSEQGRILVLGAGGGLELRALAQDHPQWRFDGVDPSSPMLDLAREIAADHLERITLHQGLIDIAPPGPFDGATCLLTFHFIEREQRLDTLRAIRQRLKPGAPLILAHISVTQAEPERSRWLKRHVLFGGGDAAKLSEAAETMATRLTILAPEEEEAMLAEAGFTGIELFYAALTFRGWVAYG